MRHAPVATPDTTGAITALHLQYDYSTTDTRQSGRGSSDSDIGVAQSRQRNFNGCDYDDATPALLLRC